MLTQSISEMTRTFSEKQLVLSEFDLFQYEQTHGSVNETCYKKFRHK